MKSLKYPKNFWIICLALLLFMISFNIILPELNTFLSEMGGADKKGLIISLFTVSALISRPFSGKLSDTIGRKKVMMIGIFVGIAVTLLYPFLGTVVLFLSLRFAHGFSAGFLPTGATALVTDILKPEQRGVGMGIWGTFISAGIGAGQILSSWITKTWGIDTLFFVAVGIATCAALLILTLKETLPNPQKFKLSFLRIKSTEIIERNVIPAAVVMFCSAISSGIVFVMTPDICQFLNIENKGWFFGFYVISTILIRLFASSLSDRIGRQQTMVIGLSFMVIAMSTIAFSTTWEIFTLGAIIFGMSTGISSPTLFAWTADLSPFHRRGIGAGTLFIALELGIMVGSASTLFIYDNTPDTVPYIFFLGASCSILAILFLIFRIRSEKAAS